MSKAMKMEVLSSPGQLARIPAMKAEIMRRAIEMAAQIVADKEALLYEPFFRSRQVAYELKRLQLVSDQRKWMIYFQRFGCLVCESMDRIHVGCGMCSRCYANTGNRLRQIHGEEIREQTARPARGRLRLDRLIPANAPLDGIHHTRYERCTEKELECIRRVAEKLGLTREYVRCVAVGTRRSDAVAAALKNERDKMLGNIAESGVKPETAAITRRAAKEALLERMPNSSEEAKRTSELFLGLPTSDSLAKKALAELLAAKLIQRCGDGTRGNAYRYWLEEEDKMLTP